jgi:hypothetical protein
VPIDYTWANEILDVELPRLFEKRKSDAAAETVSSKKWLLSFLVRFCVCSFLSKRGCLCAPRLSHDQFVLGRLFRKTWLVQLQFLFREAWAKIVMPALETLYRFHFCCLDNVRISVDIC